MQIKNFLLGSVFLGTNLAIRLSKCQYWHTEIVAREGDYYRDLSFVSDTEGPLTQRVGAGKSVHVARPLQKTLSSCIQFQPIRTTCKLCKMCFSSKDVTSPATTLTFVETCQEVESTETASSCLVLAATVSPRRVKPSARTFHGFGHIASTFTQTDLLLGCLLRERRFHRMS